MKHTVLQTEGDTNFSPLRCDWHDSLDSHSQELLGEDSKYFLKQSLSTPCLNNITQAQGIYITDAQGRQYMDFHGNSVHQLGYNNRYVIDRVQAQMDALSFSPRRYANSTATECAKRLVEAAPGSPRRVLFTPGGASSVSVALKLARHFTGRYKTISMYDSFHGANLDSISVGGEQMFHKGIGPLVPGAIHVPPLDTYRGYMSLNKYPQCQEMIIDQIEYIIEKEGDIAAVIAEPIRSTTVHIPDLEFWQTIATICRRNGVLLIFDEIPTSMGRTGKLFATEHFGVDPDMIILGKGLAGGLIPFSALLAHERLDVAEEISLGHYTFEKNPVAAEAALASLDYIQENDLLAHVQKLSLVMDARLQAMKQKYPIIGDVRGVGLLWGVEIIEAGSMKIANWERANEILYAALREGLSFKVSSGNVLTLAPPLVISEQELNRALDILERVIAN